VRSGVRHGKERGARIGRPKVAIDLAQVQELLGAGEKIQAIARKIGVSERSIRRRLATLADTRTRA
jgi:hypothetical protein